MKKHIDDLVIYIGDDRMEKGIAAAYLHVKSGVLSRTPDAPIVIQEIKGEEGKYLVVDGYHRIVEGLLSGKRIFDCRLSKTNYDWWIPTEEYRYKVPKRIKLKIK